MPRYFVAIPLPNDARDQLVRAQPAATDGLRIVSREDLHLTLHFLGEVAEAQTEALHRALAQVRLKPFPISVTGSGSFPQGSGGAVFFYARVEPAPALVELHCRVGTSLRDAIGFQIEPRPWVPHITLARSESALPPAEIEKLSQALAPLQIESLAVDRFSLYLSELVNGLPRYREQCAYRLSDGSA